MFLGSNSVRRLNSSVFTHWPHLEYLTLENIIVEDVSTCLEIVGKQLKGLKIQCAGFDLMEVAERLVFFNSVHEFPLNRSTRTIFIFFLTTRSFCLVVIVLTSLIIIIIIIIIFSIPL